MFRIYMLARALPSILKELVSLIWYSYRTGDRRTAGVALIWLVSTLLLIGFAASALASAVQGQPVELTGLFLAASLPVAMWLGHEIVMALMLAIGRLLVMFGQEPTIDLAHKSTEKL